VPRPKIGTLALSEPARTKYARGSHNRHFRQESAGKMRMPGPRSSKTIVAHCAYAAEMLTWTCHGCNFLQEFTAKKPGPKIGTLTKREPAEPKCTWTRHKRWSIPLALEIIPGYQLGDGLFFE